MFELQKALSEGKIKCSILRALGMKRNATYYRDFWKNTRLERCYYSVEKIADYIAKNPSIRLYLMRDLKNISEEQKSALNNCGIIW